MKWTVRMVLAIPAALALGFAVPASSPAAPQKPAPADKPAAPAADHAAGDKPPTPTARRDYVIGAGDDLQVFVWKEPDLTREVTVRIDGRITVPLLGDIEAAGHTPEDLGAEIGKRLARYLSTPQVTVGVSHPNSTHIYVIGQVGKPGEYPLNGRMTLLQALAVAGGFKDFAKTDGIVIVRLEKGVQVIVPANYKRLEAGKDMTQNVILQPGDTIVVP